jgi:hypothetical protein
MEGRQRWTDRRLRRSRLHLQTPAGNYGLRLGGKDRSAIAAMGMAER